MIDTGADPSAEMPRRLQSWRSMASKSAHTSSTLSCSSSASCRGTQSGLSSKALQHVLLAGQLEAHAPQAPHALAQERLHLGPGVPVVRALGADHPVRLRGSRSRPRAGGWGRPGAAPPAPL